MVRGPPEIVIAGFIEFSKVEDCIKPAICRRFKVICILDLRGLEVSSYEYDGGSNHGNYLYHAHYYYGNQQKQ